MEAAYRLGDQTRTNVGQWPKQRALAADKDQRAYGLVTCCVSSPFYEKSYGRLTDHPSN